MTDVESDTHSDAATLEVIVTTRYLYNCSEEEKKAMLSRYFPENFSKSRHHLMLIIGQMRQGRLLMSNITHIMKIPRRGRVREIVVRLLILRKFTVVTDHQALVHFSKTRKPDLRFNRLKAELRGYEFDIVYRRVLVYSNVDALSRNPVIRQGDAKRRVLSSDEPRRRWRMSERRERKFGSRLVEAIVRVESVCTLRPSTIGNRPRVFLFPQRNTVSGASGGGENRVCVLAILAAHQASPYLATTPLIRPVPFTPAANRRGPWRAADYVTPATRWSTRAVLDLAYEALSEYLAVFLRYVQTLALQRSPRIPPYERVCVSFGSECSLAGAVLQRPGVSPLRTRRRPLCEASRVHDREIFSCPVSYLASRTLVGDEHSLVWRVVHRQSRPGREGVDTGGVHGEATVTTTIRTLRAMSAETVSRLFLNSLNIVLHGNSFYMVEHPTCCQSESRLLVRSLNSLMHLAAASIECACWRLSRRTKPSPYQATTPPIRPVPFTSAANRRAPLESSVLRDPGDEVVHPCGLGPRARGSVSTELLYYSAFRADPRTTMQLAYSPV
ncbi:unnamed protein product [Trichogramma brassicae]|uniref:Reverse transcriptase RNase H-like domain-containing protein n=1 Tax=Trichogramma brassicae TaxID=86971 RepID=A0A6H5IIU5_9HYME|nr:unnamed protein product [Trichogramma brassicae]